jgi:outer membrane protein assembly factor BamB
METRADTIDLGERPRGECPGADGPLRPRAGTRLAAVLRRRRPCLSVMAVVALAMIAAADATPAPAWAELRFAVPGDNSYLDGERVFVVSSTGSQRGTMTAYRLADGAQLWQISRGTGGPDRRGPEEPEVRHDHTFTVQRGVPLHITSSRIHEGDTWQHHEAFTTAFDPATGRQVWTRPGWPIGPDTAPAGTSSGDVLLLEQRGATTRVKTAVHPPTGDIVWDIPKGPGWSRQGGAYLVSLAPEGGLTSYDIHTGTRLAAAVTGDVDAAVRGPRIADGLVLMWQHAAPPDLVAYEADTLAVRWRMPVPADSTVGDCRSVVCVHGPYGVIALDPETGAARWSANWPVGGLGRQQVRELPPPWPAGQVLMSFTGPTADYAVLLAAGTGEPLLDLDGWRPVADASPQPLLRHAEPTGRTWFGRLVLDPAGIEPLGSVGPTSGCHAVDRHLACQVDARVHVWRIHR